MDEKPFIHAKRNGSVVTIRGNDNYLLGHQITNNAGTIEGIFAKWFWDDKTLIVENDMYGFYPIYYSNFGQEICVSPSISRIIKEGAPIELDENALSVFFEMGYFIGNDTPFKHIHAIPPNVEFRWDGTLTCHGKPPVISKQQTDLTRDEAIDKYILLFENAIRRRQPKTNNFAVPLSGGRDSRHILLELHKQGFKPKVVVTAQNYPDKHSEDVNIAAMLTKELGYQHKILRQQESWFRTELKKNELTNLCSDEHAWLMVVADYLKKEVDTIYDGIAGDSLSESNFLTRKRHNMFKSGNLEAVANDFIERAPASRGFTRRGLKSFLTPDLAKKINKESAIQHLIKELEKHKNKPNPVNSFTLWNRGRREINLVPYCLFSDIPNVYAPYLDHELYKFLSTLPIEYLLDGNFHSDTIRRAYPEFAHIPFESKNSVISEIEVNKVYSGFGRELARYLMIKRPSRYLRNTFLRSALLPSLISKRYGAFTRRFTTMALYLQQLDAMTRSRKNQV
ncbi:MAG: hypothetical protein WD267_13960 [Balneolales bacterium]